MSQIKKINRFSEKYFLYPEVMKEREQRYLEHKRLEEEKIAKEMKSQKAQIKRLEEQNKENIEEILIQKGFDINNIPKSSKWIPIKHFDNKKFELKTPSQWMQFYKDEEGNQLTIDAKALVKSNEGVYFWQKVHVKGFDEESEKWRVNLSQDKELMVDRINLVFDIEDKRIFADRFISAYLERIYKNTDLKMHFYINSMPTDDIRPLKQEAYEYIVKKSFDLKYLQNIKDHNLHQTDAIIDEFYLRNCNKILFEQHLKKNPNGFIEKNELFAREKPEKKGNSNELGIIKLPRNTFEVKSKSGLFVFPASLKFQENFKLFCINSIFTSNSVLQILDEVQQINLKIEKVPLFSLSYSDCVTLQTFRKLQENQATQFMSFVRTLWGKNLVEFIKKKLSKEQGGWFDLKNINQETYEVGKLKALMQRINLIISDQIKNIVKVNHKTFVDYFCDQLPTKVEIISENQIKTHFKEQVINQDEHNAFHNLHKPLFIIQSCPIKQGTYYGENPSNFVEQILIIFKKSLINLGKIRKIEDQIIFKNLETKFQKNIQIPVLPEKRSKEPQGDEFPKIYSDENLWLWELYEKLENAITQAVEPLNQYHKFYENIVSFIELDPMTFIKKFLEDKDKYTVEKLLEGIHKIEREKDAILERFPEEIQISFFKINQIDIREKVKSNEKKVRQLLFDLIKEKAKNQIQKMLNVHMTIKSKVNKPVENIEQLVELQSYMDNQMNIEVKEVSKQLENYKTIQRILEDQGERLPGEDLKNYWLCFSIPKEVDDKKKSIEQDLEVLKESFYKDMEKDKKSFLEGVELLDSQINSFVLQNKLENQQNIYEEAQELKVIMEGILEKANQNKQREGLFNKQLSDFSRVYKMDQHFQNFFNLWRIINYWKTQKDVWINSKWDEVDAQEAERFVTEGIEELNKIKNFLKQQKTSKFQELINNMELIKNELVQFNQKVPLLVALKSKGIKQRHWQELSKKTGICLNPEDHPQFCFQFILDQGMLQHKELCVEIGNKANKEFTIEENLNVIKEKWKKLQFKTIPFNKTTYQLVSNFNDMEQELDDDFCLTETMIINPFKGPFEGQIEELNQSLLNISNIIEEWRRMQFQWAYLQPIFSSQDIAHQLKKEYSMFKLSDSFYQNLLKSVFNLKNVYEVCEQEELLDKLKTANLDFDNIQISLKSYLAVKRNKFARFYFLSDDDLLSILSETKEVERIQSHLRKVFENIQKLEFDSSKTIQSMFSVEGEKIAFSQPINPLNTQVEDWMSLVEEQMKESVKRCLLLSVEDYRNKQREQWVFDHPGQCVLNGSQIHWTLGVEEAIEKGTLQQYRDEMNSNLMKIVKMNRESFSAMQAISMEALIVIDVHALEVVDQLISENITNSNTFEWISQLRYYVQQENNESDCYVRCIQTNFPYGYEYLGNTSRLVITPLTDKCYMTLMGAIKLNLGGAPAGPAGTGKTETTKDLSKALAKQCVVFNCQESMDYKFVAKFFKGLACSGAWCCFDEFNRINIEVLSVIAQQLQELFQAKAENLKEMTFDETLIKLQPSFSVYITMNPGYAGRTELPQNLKALFRPVAMMVPNYALIGQIKLFSYGFTEAKELAKKMVATFRLASEQLSNQKHYDYGMRAVSSVINAAGLFKKVHGSSVNEYQLLLKALKDVNIPKFLQQDLPLFNNIIKDLFPKVEEMKDRNQIFNENLIKACSQLNVQPQSEFLLKVNQLQDTIKVRHGLMLVGDAAAGKTANYKVLQKTLENLSEIDSQNKKVRIEIINPKSLTLFELYGVSKDVTWDEGIIEIVMEKAIKCEEDINHWILFDGPVDAVWIESMNTVLDDNKKLCLSSGKVLMLANNITMMFEVENLHEASPATVSRCGMVYMEPRNLESKNLIKSYLQQLEASLQQSYFIEKFDELIDQICYPMLQFWDQLNKPIMQNSENSIISGFIKLFDSYFKHVRKSQNEKALQEFTAVLPEVITLVTLWSIGVNLPAKERILFSQKLQEITDRIPKGNLFDFNFDIPQNKWHLWEKQFEDFQIPSNLMFHEILVPTKDFARGMNLSKLLLLNNYHVMTPGAVGSGKTTNAVKILSEYLDDHYTSISMTLSAQTQANQILDSVFAQIDKRKKGVYGPSNGKKCIFYIDELNMPQKEIYGAQPPLELIRQYIDHSHWYVNKLNKDYIRIEDLTIFSSMVPPGTGRNDITARLTRHFNILPYTEFDEQTTLSIFDKIMRYFYQNYSQEIQVKISKIVQASSNVYEEIKKTMLPTPSKSHYLFNLRDLAKIFQGMSQAKPKQIPQFEDILRLWWHENQRVYEDRLICDEDRAKIEEILQREMQINLNYSFESIKNSDSFVFTTIINEQSRTEGYSQVISMESFVKQIEIYLTQHNQEVPAKKQMNLVMFQSACQYVARISSVLNNPMGHIILLGVGGSGRQSLGRLASYIVNLPTFSIEVSKGYNFVKWRDDIKNIIFLTICQNKAQVFIFNDTQIISEAVVEDINCILSSGQIFGLPYNPDELKSLDDVIRKECMQKNIIPNKINISNLMVSRVKKNLHVIFAMSPLDKKFSTRLRMFPALVNNCSLNWMSEWPEEALQGVAYQQLHCNEILTSKENTKLEQITQMLMYMHINIQDLSKEMKEKINRNNYLTPKSYLELLVIYKKILSSKYIQLNASLQRLQEGLSKLMNANEQVVSLKEKLTKQEPLLKEAQIEVQELLQKIQIDKIQETETKKVVAKEEAEATAQQIEANTLKSSAEESVREANEELEESLKKISLLKPNNITEVKNFSQPPNKVKVVNAAMCILLVDEKLIKKNADLDEFWKVGKNNLLSDANKLFQFLTNPETKDTISGTRIAKVKKLIETYSDVWVDKEIMGASVAIFYIYLWVKSMISYYDINLKSKPIRIELENLTQVLEEKTKVLDEKKALLDASVKKLKELEDLYTEKINFKEDLERQVKECTLKVGRAGTLTSLLADEKERWKLEINKLNEMVSLVPYDTLLISGMISYAGPFTMLYRQQMEVSFRQKMKELGISVSQNLNMASFLSTPLEIMTWNMYGLPKDETSVQNGIILNNSTRWALIIDPQKRANKFLKEMGREFRIKAIKASSNVMQEVEIQVQFESWLLIENVGEELDSSWDSILTPKITISGGIKEINIGEKICPFNDSFKFFMTTTLGNPVFSPETSAKVTIINFGITPKGLEEQLIAQIMLSENKELEKQKEEIVKQNSIDQKKLKEVEDNILISLKNSSVDILMDENLIRKLDESKKTSTQINEQMKISIETEKNIDETRENYRDLAFHSSTLFFCINTLSQIDSMYQYSLFWFESIFQQALDNSSKDNNVQQRIENIKNYFTYFLYKNVCQSLFQEDKLVVSFLMSIRLQDSYQKINQQKLKLFLLGSNVQKKLPQKPSQSISDDSWSYVYSEMKEISKHFDNNLLIDHFMNNIEKWLTIIEAYNSSEIPLPSIEGIQFDQFDRLLIMKALRRDKLMIEIQNFIKQHLGAKFVEVPIFKLHEIYDSSQCHIPLLFIITAGSDPKADFDTLANLKQIKNIQSISLGQGQEQRSVKMIKEMKKVNGNGGWVLLQNCHLMESWMTELEVICEDLSPETVHKDFRLWLTSMPSKAFPTSILQNSLKMTMEPPSGLKANLKQSYSNIDDTELNQCVSKPSEFRKLLFGLCFFHAVVQERKKFGPIGWNIPYEFTNEDLMVCKKQLRLFLEEYEEIPYKVLNFICASINYGGRVTDDKDELLIKTILKNYMNPNVLKEEYRFSDDDTYYSISALNQKAYLNYIDQLPLNTSPRVFGLHENAEITTNQNVSMTFVKTILTCQSSQSNSNKKLVDETLVLINQMKRNLPEQFNLKQVMLCYPVQYEESMNIVLLQETEKYNGLLQRMKVDLENIDKAIKGLIVLNDYLEKVLDSLMKKEVPEVWSEVFLSMKPLISWFGDLNQRCQFFHKWILEGQPNIFWFSGFSFPQAFITGIMQNYVRKTGIGIDLISFEFLFMKENFEEEQPLRPETGVYISGMFIEGAKWNYKENIIDDPQPKELFSKLPIIWLKPLCNYTIPSTGIYHCPLYKIVSRKGTLSTTGHSTNFIMKILMPTQKDPDHWIRGGVASFLSLQY